MRGGPRQLSPEARNTHTLTHSLARTSAQSDSSQNEHLYLGTASQCRGQVAVTPRTSERADRTKHTKELPASFDKTPFDCVLQSRAGKTRCWSQCHSPAAQRLFLQLVRLEEPLADSHKAFVHETSAEKNRQNGRHSRRWNN